MTQSVTTAQPLFSGQADVLLALDTLSGVAADFSDATAGLDAAAYLEHYVTALEQLGEAAGEAEYVGAQNLCLLFREQILALGERGNDVTDEIHDALAAWPELLRYHLQSVPEEAATEAIIEHLESPLWISPLAPGDADLLKELLRTDRQANDVGAEGTTPATPSMAGELPEGPSEEDLSPQAEELAGVLIEEIPFMEEPLARLLELALSGEGDTSAREDACEVFLDYLDRFTDAAEAVGFAGLGQALGRMRENLSQLVARPRRFTGDEGDALAAWNGPVRGYLNAPCRAAACQSLIDWLRLPQWPRPLSAEEAEDLLPLLQAPTLPTNDPEAESRPRQATPEDVALRLPDDVDADLLDALLQELPGQTERFSAAIQNLVAGGSADDINSAQRIAHTIKGAANTVGVSGLANLTHQLEDILVALAQAQRLPHRPLALCLTHAADCLEAMGETLAGIGDPPEDAQAVLQEVLDWANRIDREGLPETGDEGLPAPKGASSTGASPGTSPAEDPTAEPADRQQTNGQSASAPTRAAAGLVDELMRVGGETIILSGQVHEQVYRMQEQMGSMQAEFERLRQLGGELERLIDIKDLSADRPGWNEDRQFDSLEMDRYSELHTTSRMLVEAAADARGTGSAVTEQLARLDALLVTQERLNRETQEVVLRARMVPFKTVVPRLKRSLRQTCRLTGKQAELHIGGADTLLDGEVLNELIDPLMHILRNAVDHGIEGPEERTAAGKPAAGNVWLDLVREGNSVLLRCRDDGAGFDFDAVRGAAERRGLVAPGQTLSQDELKNLVLMANFSTRSEVTQTSGRGVGLDVVYSHILGRGGSFNLESKAGEGSTLELRLPVSLILTHALLVRVQRQVVAIADRGVQQILHAEDGQIREFGGQIAFQVGGLVYPLRSLDEILGEIPDDRKLTRGPMPVLLVRDRSAMIGVQVQEVLTGSDLVVKEPGRYVPRIPGILGATILGDGAVTPVLDLPELLRGANGRERPRDRETAAAGRRSDDAHLPLALVVDDSLSARRALVQVMQDAGYEVRTARDGMEAVELVEAKRPDIVLADMEMPRMNGIELTSHLRACPDTVDLPVIMITSRSSAKHRKQAEAAGINVYLTKPFMDDELLEHVAALRSRGS
jgi:chemotaxis protein histidine kinase CheA